MVFDEIAKLKNLIDKKDEEIAHLTKMLDDVFLKSKKSIQELHDYYNNIIALMPGNVYWLDKQNVFLGCNDKHAEMARLNSRKEIIGKTNADLPWKDQAEELNRLNNLVMETGISHTAEEYAVMPKGLVVYLSQKTPLRDNNNEIMGVLNVSMDITERKKMEAALRRAKEVSDIANQAKTEFIANMSHDIYTPLNGIVGLSQLLYERLEKQEDKLHSQWINESGKQLLCLLKSVLNMVADDQLIETDLHEEPWNIRNILAGLIQLSNPAAKVKKLELRLDIDDSIPEWLITDNIKLHRVLLNLLGNAIKFTHQGSINLAVKVLNGEGEYLQIEFSITDTGIGISKKLHEQIFQRFFRVNPSAQSAPGGHGMGLFIAQNYVNLLGGDIKVESDLGKGAQFSFSLPMKIAEDGCKQTTKMAKSLHSIGENHLHILLVEPNIIALRFLETLSMQAGCTFASASDAEQALELVKTMDFDLILTDLVLPTISYKELISYVRAFEKASSKNQLRIIGLCNDENEVNNEALKVGISKVTTKPLNLIKIQEIIKEFA
ncbi:MAG: PAS domain-containing protein [Proteobacteria bacterium]|nr:PAS domain-containing protein [Pseudomonadota bacterium]